MIEGDFSRASVNRLLTSFSDSPIHLDTRSEEETLKKVESASVATAWRWCGKGGGEGEDVSRRRAKLLHASPPLHGPASRWPPPPTHTPHLGQV